MPISTTAAYKKTNFNYYEKQKFKNPWLFTFLILFEITIVYICVEEFLSSVPWGMRPLSTWLIFGFTIMIPTSVLLGFYFARFDTIINENGIFYRWVPFKKNYQMIEWDSIREISIIDFTNVGWTWIFSNKYKEVQYLGGGYGMHIRMKSGRRRVIGTRKPEELNRIFVRIAGSKYDPNASGKKFEYD